MKLGTYLRARPLSKSEVIYLIHVGQGLTAVQSANRRARSENTVLHGLKWARFALGADNTLHAVTLALAYGEILIEEIHPAPVKMPARRLTEVERTSLIDAARGLTAALSSAKRQTPVNTIVPALGRARTVMGAVNTAQAVTLALATGVIAIEDVYPMMSNSFTRKAASGRE